MFSSNFKRPLLLALVVTAGLLAVAGPATANIVYNGHAGLGSAGLKFDSNEWAEKAAVEKDLNQPDMGIREQATQVSAPHGLGIGSSEVFELNTLRSNGDANDLNVAGPTSLKAGSNVILMESISTPEVDDEVLASINYEPDVFWYHEADAISRSINRT